MAAADATVMPPSWLVSFLQSINVWDALLILAAVSALVVFIRRKGWRTIRAIARGVIAIDKLVPAVQNLPAFIERTDESLQSHSATLLEHTSQLKNSHSTNLRDDVSKAIEVAVRTEKSVEGLHGRVEGLERDVRALAQADADIRAELKHNPEES